MFCQCSVDVSGVRTHDFCACLIRKFSWLPAEFGSSVGFSFPIAAEGSWRPFYGYHWDAVRTLRATLNFIDNKRFYGQDFENCIYLPNLYDGKPWVFRLFVTFRGSYNDMEDKKYLQNHPKWVAGYSAGPEYIVQLQNIPEYLHVQNTGFVVVSRFVGTAQLQDTRVRHD